MCIDFKPNCFGKTWKRIFYHAKKDKPDRRNIDRASGVYILMIADVFYIVRKGGDNSNGIGTAKELELIEEGFQIMGVHCNYLIHCIIGIQHQFIFRCHIGQQSDNVSIDHDAVMIRLEKTSFFKVGLSLAPVEILEKYHPGYADNTCNNNGPAFGQIKHFAPPCGNEFCLATESYHIEGLFISTKGGAA
jgi:hypothetical protein